jgi:hypothetical protein
MSHILQVIGGKLQHYTTNGVANRLTAGAASGTPMKITPIKMMAWRMTENDGE